MEKEFELIHNREAHSYQFHIDGLVAKADYIAKNGAIYITHTEVPPQLQGRSVGTQLILKALQEIEREGLRVVPLCPFVATYIARHPEWRRLLMEGVNVG